MSRSPPKSPSAAVTPESRLLRSDSCNATGTCKGLTSSGRPCRRSTTAAVQRASRFIAVGSDEYDDTHLVDPAVYYCWQHKAQTPDGVPLHVGPGRSKPVHSGERNGRPSLDTLVDRLGVLDLTTENFKRKQTYKENSRKPTPLQDRTRSRPGFWASLCCFTMPDEDLDDRYEIVRHRQRRPQHARQDMRQVPQQAPAVHRLPISLKIRSSSGELIPSTLSSETAALLRAELAKPISSHDEDGYIYMFWLTDDATDTPSEADTASLLGPPSNIRPSAARRTTDVLQRYGTVRASDRRNSRPLAVPVEQKTVILKIGRASNVHRRMGEWARQCGYNLSLLRFYPYVPADALQSPQAPANPPGSTTTAQHTNEASSRVRKVPFSHRVERLIHIELREQRINQDACLACGSRHREWFEVQARRQDVASVDAVVKKWVAWAELVATGQ